MPKLLAKNWLTETTTDEDISKQPSRHHSFVVFRGFVVCFTSGNSRKMWCQDWDSWLHVIKVVHEITVFKRFIKNPYVIFGGLFLRAVSTIDSWNTINHQITKLLKLIKSKFVCFPSVNAPNFGDLIHGSSTTSQILMHASNRKGILKFWNSWKILPKSGGISRFRFSIDTMMSHFIFFFTTRISEKLAPLMVRTSMLPSI